MHTTPDGEDTGSTAWQLRLWALVAVFAAVTVARSIQIGIPVRDPHGAILFGRIGVSLAIFVVLALLDGVRRAGAGNRSVRGILQTVRRRWTPRRLLLAGSALLAYHVVYFCYHNLKSWDVFNSPRDQMLLSWDHWLFFGHSPAVLLHDLLGQHGAAYVLMGVYEAFSTVVSISVVAALVFCKQVRDGAVMIASLVCVWILGVISYYVIPSLGPFHAAPQEFAGLPHTMIQDTQAKYMGQRAELLAHPHAAGSFAQISAFASLHVGVTTVIVLMAFYYRARLTSRLLVVLLAATVVATIYLGWHFAVDDIAGAAIGWVAVRLGQRMIYPRHGRAAESPPRVGTAAVAQPT